MENRNYIIEKFRHVPSNLQLVCVGTMQAHFALDFIGYPIKAFNMALWKNPVFFNKIVLEKYKDYIQANAVILITLQYPIFCIGKIEDIALENIRQYAKIVFLKNPYCSILRQMCGFLMPECFDKQTRELIAIQKRAERNKFVNHYKPWELDELCRNLISGGWEKEIGIQNYVLDGHKKGIKEIDVVMETTTLQTIDLVNYCKINGWIPILIGLPYSGVLNQYIPDSFIQKCFYEKVRDIKEKTTCEFLDYSRDERMQGINNYMGIWWLNKIGKEKFTQIVVRDIESILGKGWYV